MSKQKKVKKYRPRKFFVKENDDIIVVSSKYFDGLLTREDALGIGVQTFLELQQMLKQDVLLGEAYINTIGLVDGLERSLVELQRRFPFIIEQIRAFQLLSNGARIGQA